MRERNVKFILEYDGTRYDGWQRQTSTDNTIQGKLEQVLSRMCGQAVEIHGAGRTDGGVHAQGQVANAHLQTELSAGEIKDYVNQYLPEDIRVIEAETVGDRFHSRYHAVGKLYTYWLDMEEKTSVFSRRYTYALGETLDIKAMEEAAGYLVGTHDFKSFCGNRRMKKSTVRTVNSIEIRPHGSRLEFRFQGDGFLNHMVRILVGTLVEVGQGKKSPKQMTEILETRDRQAAGYLVPAQGLCLTEVFYDRRTGVL